MKSKDLLQQAIELLVERYGAYRIATILGEYLTPEERMRAALQWELQASIEGRPTAVDELEDKGLLVRITGVKA